MRKTPAFSHWHPQYLQNGSTNRGMPSRRGSWSSKESDGFREGLNPSCELRQRHSENSKERIDDATWCEAIDRAEHGLIDADLGGRVIKQRVARPGQGRSGGYRTLVAFRTATRAVFLHGFAKNEQDNISNDELRMLRKAASEVLGWSDKEGGQVARCRQMDGGDVR